MPRDIGTGIYTYPAGTPGITAQTIFSARYNTFINDLANTLNQALPVNMGGTGGYSAAEARNNLDVEVAGTQVTNYDTHVWEAGSFWSAVGAPGAPTGSDHFMGVCYIGNNNIFLEARAITTVVVPSPLWVRHRYGLVWGAWASEGEGYVNTAGDTMTGDLTISKNQPSIFLNKTVAGSQAVLQASNGGLARWAILASDGAADNFGIWRYSDGGSPVNAVIQLTRAPVTAGIALNGNVTVGGNLTCTDLGANTVTAAAGVISSAGNIVAQTGHLWAPNGYCIVKSNFQVGGDGVAYGIFADGTSVAIRTGTANAIYLQSPGGSTTYASFTSTGNNLVGPLYISGDTFSSGNIGITKAAPIISINSTGGPAALDFYMGGGAVSSVYDNNAAIIVSSNGTKTSGNYMLRDSNTWTSMSDARLPEKVGARPLNMLERVDQIKVYENEYNGKLTLFVIAQEFVKCLPHIVKVGSTDGKHIPRGLDDPDAWGVGYDRAGVAALQLGKEIYDAMRQQIAALTARIEALEAAQATP